MGSKDCGELHSYNERPRLCFRHCNFNEGSFAIVNAEFKLLFKDSGYVTDCYTPYIRKRIMKVNSTCVLNIRSADLNKNIGVALYGYCAHFWCKLLYCMQVI